MRKLHGSLLIVYLTAAAGYGGWRGPDLWSGWGVWCLLLPPLAWWILIGLTWRRTGGPIHVAVVTGGLSVVAIAIAAVGIAMGTAEATGRWSSEPMVRAIFGAGLGVAGCGLALLAIRARKGPSEGGGRF